MNKSWQEERKEIAVWLSGYLGMVNNWVDKVLDNEDLEVDKNKILSILSDWIEYLSDERHKIMMLKDRPVKDSIKSVVKLPFGGEGTHQSDEDSK